MTDDRQVCGLQASCCLRSCCSFRRPARRTTSCRPSGPTATPRASKASAHRHLDHRAGLLPLQEEDGRRLRRCRPCSSASRVAEGRRPHRRILRHAGDLSRQGRSAGAVHDRRCASREARARAATAGLRGCGLVLSAAEMAGRSCLARGRQERGRRAWARCLARNPPPANGDFLPPDAAFRFGAGMPQPDSIALTWVIADGYYLYKDKISVESDDAERAARQAGAAAGQAEARRVLRRHRGVLRSPRSDAARRACREQRSAIGAAEGDVSGLRRRRPLLQPDHEGSRRRVAAHRRRDDAACRCAASIAEQERRRADGRGAGQARRGPARRQSAVRAAHVLRRRPGAVAHAVRAADDPDPVRHHRRPGRGRHAGAQLLARVHVRAGHGADLRRGGRDLRARFQAGAAGVLPAAVDRHRCWCCCSWRSRSRCSAPTRCSCRARCRRGSAMRAIARSRARTSAPSSWARCRRSS